MSKVRRMSAVTPTPFADNIDAVADFAQDLPESFLLCRDMGHNWRPFNARVVPEDHTFERTIRCSRCKTKRVQILSERGAVLSSHYIYVDGYQAPAGTGRMTGASRDELRRVSLVREIDKYRSKASA